MAKRTFLNPARRGRKFGWELKTGYHYTDDGQLKVDENGDPQKLTPTEASFRMGALYMREEEAKAYKANERKRKEAAAKKRAAAKRSAPMGQAIFYPPEERKKAKRN